MASAQDFKSTDLLSGGRKKAFTSPVEEEMVVASTDLLSGGKKEAFTSPVEEEMVVATPLPLKYGKFESGKVSARPSVKRVAMVSPEVSPSGLSNQPSMKKLVTTTSPTKSVWNFLNPFFRTSNKKELEEVFEPEFDQEDNVEIEVSKEDESVLTTK